MVTKDSGGDTEIEIVVNIPVNTNVVGSSATVQGINTSSGSSSESEIEVGDVEVESESGSKAKASADGGGDFSPGPNGPPGQGSAKSESVLDRAKKLLPSKKTTAKSKKEDAKD